MCVCLGPGGSSEQRRGPEREGPVVGDQEREEGDSPPCRPHGEQPRLCAWSGILAGAAGGPAGPNTGGGPLWAQGTDLAHLHVLQSGYAEALTGGSHPAVPPAWEVDVAAPYRQGSGPRRKVLGLGSQSQAYALPHSSAEHRPGPLLPPRQPELAGGWPWGSDSGLWGQEASRHRSCPGPASSSHLSLQVLTRS